MLKISKKQIGSRKGLWGQESQKQLCCIWIEPWRCCWRRTGPGSQGFEGIAEKLANLLVLTSSTNKREEFLGLLVLENKAYHGG